MSTARDYFSPYDDADNSLGTRAAQRNPARQSHPDDPVPLEWLNGTICPDPKLLTSAVQLCSGRWCRWGGHASRSKRKTGSGAGPTVPVSTDGRP